MNERMKKIILFVVPLVLVLVMFIIIGNGKRITFCDEIYTYTIVNSDKLLNQYDFNVWMSGGVLNNALIHDGSDSLGRMIGNVKGDMVHPPIYYILVYIAACLFSGKFSLWVGLLVNLGALLVSAAAVWLIFYKLFDSPRAGAFAVVLYAINQSTLSSAMLIRMYMVYTMFVLLFLLANVYLHSGKKSIKKYVALAATTVGGFLTQYYFAIIAVLFFLAELVRAIRRKCIKEAVDYLLAMIGAVLVSTALWSFWIRAVLGNTHAGAMKESALGFFDNIKKIGMGYMMMMHSVFQNAGAVFAVIVPVVIFGFAVALLLSGSKEKQVENVGTGAITYRGAYERAYVAVVSFVVAVVYSAIVRVITPEYLTSTRYYYAADALLLVGFLVALLGVAGLTVRLLENKKISSGSKKSRVILAVCIAVASFAGAVLILCTGEGIDYYSDTKTYDSSREPLLAYADVPWIVGGVDSWMMDTCITDFVIPKKVMRLINTEPVMNDLFDGIDEFVFAENNPENDRALTERNLYFFTLQTGKNVEYEWITKSKDLNYYHCVVSDRNGVETEAIREFIKDNLDCPWLVVNNSGWYRPEDILTEEQLSAGGAKATIYVDDETPFDESGALADYRKAVIVVSILDISKTPEDEGVYYMIGSTGRFYQSEYIGQMGDMMLFACELKAD